MTLIYLTLCWGLGILFAEALGKELPFGLIAIGFACLLVWFRDRAGWRLILGCGLLFALGGLRLEEARPAQSPDHIANLNNQGWVTLDGIVWDEPDRRDTYTNIRLKVDRVVWLAEEHPAEGLVLVRLPAQTAAAYGDRLLATGELRAPPELDTFSYRDQLARSGIFSAMQPLDVQVIGHSEGRWWRETLLDQREKAKGYIQDALPEPQASLLSGILLGDDSGLARDVRDAFNETGASHIIAISGFNLALIGSMVNGLLTGLLNRKRLAVFISLILIALYTLLVGANPGVVRAAIMTGMALSATLVRRRTYVPASLAFAALLMSLLDPWVLWDIGFQLSFAAILGIVLLVPPLEHWVNRRVGSETARLLAQPLAVSVAAQAAALPLILAYFGRLPVWTLVVNLLVVPVQPLLLAFGGAATLVSFVAPGIGHLLYQAAWLFLTWTVEIVRAFADLPASTLDVWLSQEVLIGLGIMALTLMILNATRPPWYERWWKKRRRQGRQWVGAAPMIAGVVLLGLLLRAMAHQPDGKLHVVYLDMGQTNSALISSPDGAVFLINGGQYPSRLLTALGDHLPANRRQIDVLWITNDAREEIGALAEVIERYEVKAVITSIHNSSEPEYVALIERLLRDQTPVLQAEAGYRVETDDGTRLQILAPATEQEGEKSDSIVLRLEYGEAVFLFTSTLSASDEASLLQQAHWIQASVLQAADYAAEDSNSAAWVAVVNPQVVVIHNDPASRASGAAPSVLANFEGRRIYRTDVQGEIEIVTDGRVLEIQPENK